tara:strand:+ start:415 stop:537 length:123 start_codon:yes stop_codon:yes gene_type:complete
MAVIWAAIWADMHTARKYDSRLVMVYQAVWAWQLMAASIE